MSYSQEKFLIDMGFVLDPNCEKYSSLGVTYKITSDEMDGYYWFYDTDLFSINIHDFKVKKDLIVNHKFTDKNEILVQSSFLKCVHGECLSPYQEVSNNMVFVNFVKANVFRFFLHGGFPYFSLGVEFKKKFLEEYIPEKIGIEKEELFNIFQSSNSLNISCDIEKIANEILMYRKNTPGSELFYEVKAKEWLSITINEYFQSGEKGKLSMDDDVSLNNVARYIDDHYSSEIPQALLCEIALMSKTKLKNSFKAKYRMTITEYIQRRRVKVAEHMILTTELSIKEIAKLVGYNSHSRFSKLFKKYTGLYPHDLKKMV
ncbi:helix-turn-helix domain-containing protein [Peptostreptococcus canis]|uniref:Helix-turn-helix transcriptional regulator n=1 Tax=Peptostreptococcus canis TaxID=1159213 RepID=A0ABR6TLM0_9FIRM|nr:AraC family transcriptional regulator [Peptostreptococcus canis]MBC2576302.1 helix-turn-helix transcriptional regulator [Peptostreptococcus canis]MBP1998500.1 AraC-like DNA-binding protein [Peptostreptococcus canis]